MQDLDGVRLDHGRASGAVLSGLPGGWEDGAVKEEEQATMATWRELEATVPALAKLGRAALYRSDVGEGWLATLRGGALPRIHPLNVGIVEGRLLVFVQPASAKTRDLATDGRYALHAFQDPAVPHEFLVRGRATTVTDPALRALAVAVWPFDPGDDYPLFELGIEHVLYGERGDPDTWPPRYSSWRAPATGGV